MERMDKLLASTGRWSRKEVKELIRQMADGRPVGRPEERYEPGGVYITVDGEAVDASLFVYVMLHKPAGLLSATEDSRQPTVLDLLPPELKRRGLFPVGRLDKDTTGLLLLTDDGELAHRLLSPKKHVDKVYVVRVEGRIDQEDVRVLGEGMTLGDGLRCLPAGLEPLGDGGMKRMLAARGKPVLALHRLSMGSLTLDEGLKPGQWRFLSKDERAKLTGIGNAL